MPHKQDSAELNANNVYEFTVKDVQGKEVSLERYRGKVLLIVNVASECSLAPSNYRELGQLHEKYNEAGLAILAFPCNQFANQEPGNSEETVCFATKRNARFDIFEKINVNGSNAHPLYQYLKTSQPGWFGNAVKWNFTKFIVNKEGVPVRRYSPSTSPMKLVSSLESYLAA